MICFIKPLPAISYLHAKTVSEGYILSIIKGNATPFNKKPGVEAPRSPIEALCGGWKTDDTKEAHLP
jgi:hypothetical protein